MKIRYRGGPLDRTSYHGPSQQPMYRDAAGTVIPYREGVDQTLDSARRALAAGATYVYDKRHCRYDHIDLLVAETRTARIKALVEEKAKQPERGEEIEQQIRELENAA